MEPAIAALRRVAYDPDGQVLLPPSPGRPQFDSPLARMYAVCDGLSLMELHVGYHIDRAARTATAAARGCPVRVATTRRTGGVTPSGDAAFDVTCFGSDGGGALFVLRRDDGAVHHLVEAGVDRGVCWGATSTARIADSIEQFLWLLLDDLHAYVGGIEGHVYLADRWHRG